MATLPRAARGLQDRQILSVSAETEELYSCMIHTTSSYGEAEHQKYEQDGYRIFPRFLKDDALANCRANLERVLRLVHHGRQDSPITSAHFRVRWIWDLAIQPPVLDLIERQAGPNILLWSTALICRPPGICCSPSSPSNRSKD